VAEALAARARDGLEVRLLLDASGTSRMDEELLAMMRQAGVRAVKYHPFEFALIGRVNNRDHRKIAVLDGRVGYLFGHGVAREWEGDAEDPDHWRDTAVRVEGPVVQGIQSVFSENWVEATGEAFVGEGVYPALGPAGEMVTHLAWSSPTGTVSSVELLHFLAIAAARRELLIQNPYLIPDQDLRDALAEAVRRGVEVEIMVPGEVIDSQFVRHAAHWRYAPLLASGVRICEYRKTLNHQKVMVVDRIWSLVGSTNFDSRSFEINDEVSMGILDAGVAAELAAAFERDRADCQEIELETWQGRSLRHKAIDKLAHLVHEQL
jgi:cardiolipin synthase